MAKRRTTNYHKTVEQAVENVRDDFQTKLELIADTVRRELVIPACRRYGLEFFAGNNNWFFCKGDTVIHNAAEARELGLALHNEMVTLALEVDGHVQLGTLMANVQKEDLF